jgi:hypothetical protein
MIDICPGAKTECQASPPLVRIVMKDLTKFLKYERNIQFISKRWKGTTFRQHMLSSGFIPQVLNLPNSIDILQKLSSQNVFILPDASLTDVVLILKHLVSCISTNPMVAYSLILGIVSNPSLTVTQGAIEVNLVQSLLTTLNSEYGTKIGNFCSTIIHRLFAKNAHAFLIPVDSRFLSGFHTIFSTFGDGLKDFHVFACIAELIERGLQMDVNLVIDSHLMFDLMNQSGIVALQCAMDITIVHSSNSKFLDHLVRCGLITHLIQSFTNQEKISIREKIQSCLLIVSLDKKYEAAVKEEASGVKGLEMLCKQSRRR